MPQGEERILAVSVDGVCERDQSVYFRAVWTGQHVTGVEVMSGTHNYYLPYFFLRMVQPCTNSCCETRTVRDVCLRLFEFGSNSGYLCCSNYRPAISLRGNEVMALVAAPSSSSLTLHRTSRRCDVSTL